MSTTSAEEAADRLAIRELIDASFEICQRALQCRQSFEDARIESTLTLEIRPERPGQEPTSERAW